MKFGVKPAEVKKIGLVGAGLIGTGWAIHFLAQGLDVVVTDPSPKAENKMRDMVSRAWPIMQNFPQGEGACQERLIFSTNLRDAIEDVDFIQESTPEEVVLKSKVMTAIGDVARPDVVIASSSSGFMPSKLQAMCKNPERVIIGHPFHPVYLMPLVEIVGGEKTSRNTIKWAMEFYEYWGKEPLYCRSEIEGHLGNRLQAAVRNEMLHLVSEGIATPEEIDTALCSAAGLRWALFGPSMIFRSNCGDKDIREALQAWAPVFRLPHSKLAAPDMSKGLIDQMTKSINKQVDGHSAEEICAMRDEFLVGVLKLRKQIEVKYGFRQGRFQSTVEADVFQ